MKRRGIRRKVTHSVTILVIVSLTLLGIVLSVINFNNQKKQLTRLQDEAANYAVNEIAWDIHEIETLLHITTINYDLMHLSSERQFDALSQILTHQDIKQHNVLDKLILLDRNGAELAKVSRTEVYAPSELGDWSTAEQFLIPLKTGEIHYGPMIFDVAIYEPHIMMSMPLNNIRSGELEGMLLGRIRLHRIWENAVERSFGESGIIFITNSKGKVVAHPDPSVIYRNTVYEPETPRGIQTGLNGKKIQIVSKSFRLGAQVFNVYAALPFKEVLSLSLNTLSATSLFVVIFILFSISVSYGVVQRIVRPIETLAGTARDISLGKIGLAIEPGDSDEIGDLSSAFNLMTSRLLETIDSLKHQMSELTLAEEKIKGQHEFLNVILNSLTHPFYVIDINDYTVKMANKAAKFGKLSGGSTCYALTHNSDAPCNDLEHPCVINKIKETGKPVTVEHTHHDSEGNTSINEIHGYPIFGSNGDVSQVIEYNLDITDRKKMEEALQVSEEKNRSITSTAKDAMIMIDDKGCVTFWNPAAEKIFGYAQEEVMNKELHPLIIPDKYLKDYRAGMRRFSEAGTGPGIGETLEMTAKRKDGTEFPVELSLSSIQVKDRWSAIGIVRDITARRETDNKILESLKEKEVLLREIHHRTKNNMQVISSLLNLQAEHIQDKRYVAMLHESRNRIYAMALVHEKLYRSKDLAKIDFNDYIRGLSKGLFAFYGVGISQIELDLNIENIILALDDGIPCGLIINELISNSLKHAFPGGRKGKISICFKKETLQEDEVEYHLTVSDDGVGIPESIDIRNTKSLGLQIVTNLVEHQLQGRIELDRTKGTEFRIRFRAVQYKKRI